VQVISGIFSGIECFKSLQYRSRHQQKLFWLPRVTFQSPQRVKRTGRPEFKFKKVYSYGCSKTIINKNNDKNVENKTPYLKARMVRVKMIAVSYHFNSYLSVYSAELRTQVFILWKGWRYKLLVRVTSETIKKEQELIRQWYTYIKNCRVRTHLNINSHIYVTKL